jgi:hypothetical protein
LTTPHVVVVHARQIVVHEGIRVYDLNRGRDSACIPISARGTISSENEHPPHSLSAVGQCVGRCGASRFGELGDLSVDDFCDGRLDLDAIR